MLRTKRWMVVLALAALALAACGEEDAGDDAGAEQETSDNVDCFEDGTTTESGLEIKDIECGDGAVAEDGSLVSVHYVGTLEDGTQFDSSRERGQPFEFMLGAGSVIQGWDEGVAGMRVGGTRQLTIPPELGYGEAGAGGVIPPNATLIFEVELLEVTEASPAG